VAPARRGWGGTRQARVRWEGSQVPCHPCARRRAHGLVHGWRGSRLPVSRAFMGYRKPPV